MNKQPLSAPLSQTSEVSAPSAPSPRTAPPKVARPRTIGAPLGQARDEDDARAAACAAAPDGHADVTALMRRVSAGPLDMADVAANTAGPRGAHYGKWQVLYCGGTRFVVGVLKGMHKDLGLPVKIESFDW